MREYRTFGLACWASLSTAVLFGARDTIVLFSLLWLISYLPVGYLTTRKHMSYNFLMSDEIPNLTPDTTVISGSPRQADFSQDGRPVPPVIMVKKTVKVSGKLDKEDWAKWRGEFVPYFIVPVGTIALATLQARYAISHKLPDLSDLGATVTAMYATGIGMLINLLGKRQAGI